MPKQGQAANGAIDCAAGTTCMLRFRPGDAAVLLVRKPERQKSCGGIAVIVAAQPARSLCPQPWPKLVDRFTVWRDGATAIWLDGRRARVLTDRAERGTRPGCRRRRNRAPGSRRTAAGRDDVATTPG